VFCNTDESPAKEDKYLNILLQKQVDGFLLVPTLSRPNAVLQLQRHAIPVVVMDRRIPDVDVDVVYCDSLGGAYQLTRYLISLGHSQIAMLSGTPGVSTADERVAGYRKAYDEACISVDESYIFRGDFTQDSGYVMTRQALALPLRPTALIAANNFITIGAMKALQEVHLEVPEDVALAGFDDLPPAKVTFPFFTVAYQPAYEMGARATQLLLERLADPSITSFQEIVLPTHLIIRRSSGDPLR